MFRANSYNSAIQPKTRTAKVLAERAAKEWQSLGYKTEIRQKGEFWEVWTDVPTNPGAFAVEVE